MLNLTQLDLLLFFKLYHRNFQTEQKKREDSSVQPQVPTTKPPNNCRHWANPVPSITPNLLDYYKAHVISSVNILLACISKR